ncbi:MAG: transcription termination factor Rho, partial [Chthoniobacteraceae bacterium]
YIPRHLAKQLEQGEQTPDEIIAAAQAAQAARAEPPRQERQERPERADRGDRGERPERQERQDRLPRHERHEQHHERGERHEGGREGRQEQPPRDEEIGTGEGIVEISGKGFGFLRDAKRGFAQHPADVFVTPELVRKYNLRDGQWIKGETRRGGRGSQLHKIESINGDSPEKARTLPAFDELTVVNPLERIRLETVPDRYTTRVVDLMCPIGRGQRGLIVAPPRTGKTTLLQHIADAVTKNHPEIQLIMLLVDERPEEVTEIKRSVPNAEVMASSNDQDVKSHTRIAQLAVERAKRLVESGRDVFILLDSITRVGRAFNNATGGGGRTMSGGMDSRALETPRKLFAAARNTEEAGSLTIIGTALVETGSRMDDLIFQEFKGTGNMELVLDRKISDQRIYPAVDIFQSGTRREELLVPADDLHKIAIIRRGLAGHKPVEAIERLLFFAKKFPTNAQMLREIPG